MGIINNVSIRGCVATNYGGGINIDDAETTFTNVEINDCSAGIDGGGIYTQNNVTIEADFLEIHGCQASADGGGICFDGNNAANSYRFRRTLIYNNSADGAGGGVCYKDHASSTTKMQRCVVNDNTATTAGGCEIENGNVYLVNCTIVYNDEEGVLAFFGNTYVTNCIVWGNDVQLDLGCSSNLTVTYSCIEDGYAGTGNVSGAPVFFGEGKHLYALNGICDAVDSANSGATNYFGVDVLGNSEFDHPDVTNTGVGSPDHADMGAYEFKGFPINSYFMTQYYLDMDVATGDDTVYQYAIVRLPYLAKQWAGFFGAPRLTRCKVQSEVEIDDSTSELTEDVAVENITIAHRETLGTAYASPTRDIDYEEQYQSDGDSTISEQRNYPDGTSIDEDFFFVVFRFAWTCDPDGTVNVYNVDVEHFHNVDYEDGLYSDNAYSYFDIGAHPGSVIFAPDIPVSAWHIRTLQDAILRMVFNARFISSIPVFGKSKNPIV